MFYNDKTKYEKEEDARLEEAIRNSEFRWFKWLQNYL
jgi:hypothetical protein